MREICPYVGETKLGLQRCTLTAGHALGHMLPNPTYPATKWYVPGQEKTTTQTVTAKKGRRP